ncbi:hypothetical protein [Catenuloplanes japonicus]|uniref:hypothetical protein n=1 Tax=Catenuloplanes japonicus TaxID=33876 RepID=UPI000525C441|nr:hypothetical protein [Catenuloplanes japonicus]
MFEDLSVAMWGLLIAGGSVIVALIFLAVVSLTTRESVKAPDPALLREAADELAELAAVAYAKAGRAAAAAEQARTAATDAEEARDEAWRVQEIADAAYDAARKDVEDAAAEIAAAAAMQAYNAEGESSSTSEEDTDERDRTVSRAALGAYKRGEISVEELRDVFRVATTDQSPIQSERERVAYRYQTEQRAARRLHDRAAATARAADEAARIAEIAAIALAEEAAQAAAEAHEAMLVARHHTERKRRR